MYIKSQGPAGIAEHYIVESIWIGKFSPGTILPAERELADSIGVTRTTLREVLQRLARDGWLTIQHGKGTRINNVWECSSLNILETLVRLDKEKAPELIDNLMEIRTDICGIYIRAAIKNGQDAAIAAFAELNELDGSAEAYANFDYKLYHNLAAASGNPIYMLVLNGFKGLYTRLAKFYFTFDEARALSHQYYQDLLSLAESGDYEAVLPLIRQHGRESGELFNQYRHEMPPIE